MEGNDAVLSVISLIFWIVVVVGFIYLWRRNEQLRKGVDKNKLNVSLPRAALHGIVGMIVAVNACIWITFALVFGLIGLILVINAAIT